jgi:biopolymer transport protein ExbD
MKRYSQRSGHTAMAELNVTPLLDLAFVLLIIFIITTPLLESNIPMQLPTGSLHNSPAPDPKSIRTVSIDARGSIYLDDRPIGLSELERELSVFSRATPDAAVVVYADKSLHYQQVVDVFDVLQQAQISRMSLQKNVPR